MSAKVMWFSEVTGELFEEEPEGVETTRIEVPKDFSLGAWLRCVNALENELATVRTMSGERIKQLKGRIRGVVYWGQPQAEEATEQEMQRRRARTKSIITLDGRVGWRKDTAIKVEEAEALPYCEAHHPQAIRVKKSIIKGELPKGEEIPGVRWPEGDIFFYRFSQKEPKPMDPCPCGSGEAFKDCCSGKER